jgi:hypothetical protein
MDACLKCGAKVTYVGITVQECVTPDCENFSGREAAPEAEGYVTWGDLNLESLAGIGGLIWP